MAPKNIQITDYFSMILYCNYNQFSNRKVSNWTNQPRCEEKMTLVFVVFVSLYSSYSFIFIKSHSGGFLCCILR
jgi:hypothetical protein